MAVTSIWPISGAFAPVIDYAVNPEKTSVQNLDAVATLHAIDNVVEYAANDLKTEKRMFVTGINCSSPYYSQSFLHTKRAFNKLGGRTCYHGYQSFKAGEVDAQTAHAIGVALAKELWADRFEVVVATHLNTGHYHNHFVLNSVSCIDGLKYYNFKSDYRRMRQVSDRLCKEHKLSVIHNPKGQKKNYAEWSAEKEGRPTYRSMVKADIDRAISASTTMRDFYKVMEQMGYTFKRYKKNGQPLAHPVAIPPDSSRGVRMDGLGADYTFEGITTRILQNMRKRIPFPEVTDRRLGRYRCKGRFKSFPKATGLQALYLYYCYQLKIIKKRPTSVKRVSALLREDVLKLEHRINETRFLGKYHIETADDLISRKTFAQERIVTIAQQRKDLRNTLKRLNRQSDAEGIEATTAEIQVLSAQLKELRREVKLCDSIAVRSGLMKEELDRILQQQITDRKEKTTNEHISRRSRTGHANDPQWRRSSR